MKKHTQEEIINALKVIQGTCKTHPACNICPLSIDNVCVFQDQAPEDWEINTSPPVWKAFK